MKKAFIIVIAVVGFALTTVGQSDDKKPVKKEGKAIVTKTVKTNVVLKKDGTPDKRYKNTTEKNIVLKKDGTPDRRYKNTTVSKKVILKKDGTPDKRYKN